MNIAENMKMAFESIRSNKLRSFLTMLGIIIGISSVITIVSLGQGGKSAITGEFEKIGAATISIRVNAAGAHPSDYITLEDVKDIKSNVETVKYATPFVQRMGVINTSKKNKKAVIMGTNPDIGYITNLEIARGRFFNDRETIEGKPVIVLDEITADSIFGNSDAVGKTLSIGSKISPKKVTVVGVTKSSKLMFGADEGMPAMVYMPVSFEKVLFSQDFYIDQMYVMADSKENAENTGNSSLNVLQSRHNSRGRDIYKADNLLKELDEVNKVLGIFTTFIGAVAAISLLVGGIGVMNIMLVSVTERTREIGIRKAIGATTSTILFQFLTESIMISLFGGVIGMLIGILGAEIIGSFAGIYPVISKGAVVGVILFSSSVGIFFGIYPARKAAMLDPIDALRYE